MLLLLSSTGATAVHEVYQKKNWTTKKNAPHSGTHQWHRHGQILAIELGSLVWMLLPRARECFGVFHILPNGHLWTCFGGSCGKKLEKDEQHIKLHRFCVDKYTHPELPAPSLGWLWASCEPEIYHNHSSLDHLIWTCPYVYTHYSYVCFYLLFFPDIWIPFCAWHNL